MMSQIEIKKKLKVFEFAVELRKYNRKKICSSRVPVITKKPLSNLTTDKGFFSCGSSGGNMVFIVMKCIKLHFFLYEPMHFLIKSVQILSDELNVFKHFCKMMQSNEIQNNIGSSRVPVFPFLIVLNHD